MSEEQVKNDLSMWLSTYGLITIERLLERYKIRLPQKQLLTVIKNPHSFYHQLLRAPLKNVLNGIILQQARDYQIYAQKLFVDYLISGESNNEEAGELTREDLESERKKVVEMGERFQQCKINHNDLIADSQKSLIKYAHDWQNELRSTAKKIKVNLQNQNLLKDEKTIITALNILLAHDRPANNLSQSIDNEMWSDVEKLLEQALNKDLKEIFTHEINQVNSLKEKLEESLSDYINQISEISAELKQWRQDFYTVILRINELIKLLPDYRFNPIKEEENRESLHFDSHLGD